LNNLIVRTGFAEFQSIEQILQTKPGERPPTAGWHSSHSRDDKEMDMAQRFSEKANMHSFWLKDGIQYGCGTLQYLPK
jgi:hypothetical protein